MALGTRIASLGRASGNWIECQSGSDQGWNWLAGRHRVRTAKRRTIALNCWIVIFKRRIDFGAKFRKSGINLLDAKLKKLNRIEFG